jgi:aryl-alcohol dehydrogenase-like predicted oxidoreductase
MAFYAYRPLAGGLLAKKVEEVVDLKAGTRFVEMQVFRQMYLKGQILEELRKLTALCEENGISLMETTLRWLVS